MKKIGYLFVLIPLIVACDDECKQTKNCVGDILKQHNMVPYLGQEIACNLYLALYDYRGEQYFRLNNHCADMVANPFNCDGVLLCDESDSPSCKSFAEEAEYIGIVGIAQP